MSTISAGTTSTTGISVSSDTSGNLVLNPTNFLSATPNSLGTSRVPAEQFYELNTALAGANATGVQNILGVGVTLVGSTIYQFEGFFPLSKSAGVTSHTISLLFGGTATINNIAYSIYSQTDTVSWLGIPPSGTATYGLIQAATATVITGAQTAAAQFRTTFIKGIVSINAGGTLIPQYSLSAAPGGAYTTAIGSYFKISPLAVSGSNVSIGNWA